MTPDERAGRAMYEAWVAELGGESAWLDLPLASRFSWIAAAAAASQSPSDKFSYDIFYAYVWHFTEGGVGPWPSSGSGWRFKQMWGVAVAAARAHVINGGAN